MCLHSLLLLSLSPFQFKYNLSRDHILSSLSFFLIFFFSLSLSLSLYSTSSTNLSTDHICLCPLLLLLLILSLSLSFLVVLVEYRRGVVVAVVAMAFSGTTQKCRACEKTVYLVDQLTADEVSYHRACFRCHHCKGTLNLNNYSSYEGTLYCKPHFNQLLKTTGSLEKSFVSGKMAKFNERGIDNELQRPPSKISSLFSGTQDKCVACGKTVYPIEKVGVEGVSYHRPCFKCSHGGCTISPSNYVAHEGRLYCRHHHSQLFKEKGNFSQLVKLPLARAASQDATL